MFQKLEAVEKRYEDLNKLIYASMLCNDTKISENKELAGDPTETALAAHYCCCVRCGLHLDTTPVKGYIWFWL